MSVQKIELEEVQMLQASDTALEAAVGLTSTTLHYSGAFGCSTAVEWCS
jgi:hypothetical protein